VAQAFHVLKSGLFSANLDVAVWCSRVLSKIAHGINEIGGELAGLQWDWFIDSREGEEESGLSSTLYAVKRHDFASHALSLLL